MHPVSVARVTPVKVEAATLVPSNTCMVSWPLAKNSLALVVGKAGCERGRRRSAGGNVIDMAGCRRQEFACQSGIIFGQGLDRARADIGGKRRKAVADVDAGSIGVPI